MNWTGEVSRAETVDSVVLLTNRYLQWLGDATLARFPATCRPATIEKFEDVHRWRRTLLTETCAIAGTPDLRLQDLTVFFLRASARLNALAGIRSHSHKDLTDQVA